MAVAPPPGDWWVIPGVGLIGAVVAYRAVVVNRRMSRTRATLDLIERTESTEHYRNIRRSFVELEGETVEPGRFLRPVIEDDKVARRNVVAYLNHYELIAIGCRKGILDRRFYGRWMRSQFVKDWRIARAFVVGSRNAGATKAYVEFQRLAEKFESTALREERLGRLRDRVEYVWLTGKFRRPSSGPP